MSSISEKDVIQFLSERPEFFVNNPESLQRLSVGQSEGQVVSLAERKMRQLQEKNAQMTQQMKQLVANAHRNNALMERLFQLLTELAMHAPKDKFVSAVVAFIEKDFPSDCFQLLLTDMSLSEDHEQIRYYSQERKAIFKSFERNSEPMSGRLPQLKMDTVFGKGAQAKSAAILPIGAGAKHGLMAFGSQDENKFQADMASDVLQKLAAILASFFDQG